MGKSCPVSKLHLPEEWSICLRQMCHFISGFWQDRPNHPYRSLKNRVFWNVPQHDVDASLACPVHELEINKRGRGFDLILELLFEEGPKAYLPSHSHSCWATEQMTWVVLCVGTSWDFSCAEIWVFALWTPHHPLLIPLPLAGYCCSAQKMWGASSGFPVSYATAVLQGLFSVAETKEITSWIPITNKLFLKCHNCSAAAARATKYRTLIKYYRWNQFAESLTLFSVWGAKQQIVNTDHCLESRIAK